MTFFLKRNPVYLLEMVLMDWRHLNILREQRLCTYCKCIDDEKHFLLHCTINSELRCSFFKHFEQRKSNFNNLSESKKLSYILNPSNE
jgi:hypothetical protein